MQLTEYGDYRIWSFEDLDVTRLYIDYSLGLLMSGEDGDLTLTIHAPLSYRAGTRTYDAEAEKIESIAPVLDVLHKSAAQLIVHRNGDLVLKFSDQNGNSSYEGLAIRILGNNRRGRLELAQHAVFAT